MMKKATPKKRIGSLSLQQESELPKLAAPAQQALATAGIHKLEQLTKYAEDEIKHLHGMGPNALGKLRQALAEKGLSFKDKA